MKKTLVSALTTALVVGVASTTFAAANPFMDVPADHWAYDAVAQLAADGIIEGYPDGTFQGQNNITRYEMAQMVAKAMAYKGNVSPSSRAMIEKLAAELGDELASLHIRVAKLEKKVDNVTWTGHARYEYTDISKEDGAKSTANTLRFRIEPHMKINDQWTVHGRIEMNGLDANKGTDSIAKENELKIQNIYAQTKLGRTSVKLGRFSEFDDVSSGMLLDNRITGAEVLATNKNGVNLKLAAGNFASSIKKTGTSDARALYLAAELYQRNHKWEWGVGYHSYEMDVKGKYDVDDNDPQSKISSWDANAVYHFGKAFALVDYARGLNVSDQYDANSYRFELSYSPVKKVELHVDYMNLPKFGKISQTYSCSATDYDQQGWDVGFNWYIQKNVKFLADYFWGNDKIDGKNLHMFFSRLEFKF